MGIGYMIYGFIAHRFDADGAGAGVVVERLAPHSCGSEEYQS